AASTHVEPGEVAGLAVSTKETSSADIEASCAGGGSFDASADLATGYDVVAELDWGWHGLDSAKFGAVVFGGAEVGLTASANASCTAEVEDFLPTIHLPPIFLPGPLPPILPEVEFEASLSGTVTGSVS